MANFPIWWRWGGGGEGVVEGEVHVQIYQVFGVRKLIYVCTQI